MKKFKVGQKVKLKSADELTKISNYNYWTPKYKALAGKILEIYEVYEVSSSGVLYQLKNENDVLGYWFSEELFEEFFEEHWFEDLKAIVEI